MTAPPELFRHFPVLRQRLAWTALARPTPVTSLPRLGAQLRGPAVWLKREDRTSERCGGCEARELEFLFGTALRRGAQRLLAFGHVGSRRCLALAAFAQHFELETILALGGGTAEPNVQGTLQMELALGAELHRLDGGPLALFRLVRRCARGTVRRGGPRFLFVVWPGQAALLGALGTVNAVFELQRQLRCGIVPEPERLYAGTDSVPTLAGLAVGAELIGLRAPVVCTVGRAQQRAVLRLAGRTLAFLHRHLHDSCPQTLPATRFEFHAAADSTPTPQQAARLLRDLEALELPSPAGAAAMAALVGDRRAGRVHGPVLFWYTDAPPPQEAAAPLAALPREFRAFSVPS